MAAPVIASGSFTATGSSAAFSAKGVFSVVLSNTFVGTVILERSTDDGATWVQPTVLGTSIYSWTAKASEPIEEPANGIVYRLRCTAYSSGQIDYRVTQ